MKKDQNEMKFIEMKQQVPVIINIVKNQHLVEANIASLNSYHITDTGSKSRLPKLCPSNRWLWGNETQYICINRTG